MPYFDCTQNLILENKRTRLTPLQLVDAPKLYPVALEEKRLLQFSPTEIHSESLLQMYIQVALTAKQDNNRYPFLIFDKKLNQYAGSTSFMNISNQNSRIEIGATWIGKAFQKTGLNRANKYLMLQYAFEVLAFERVELKTDARNAASRKAMEKIGATYEGKLRSHTIMPDGYRRDTCYYSILKSEWPTIKANIFSIYLK